MFYLVIPSNESTELEGVDGTKSLENTQSSGSSESTRVLVDGE